VMSPYHEPVIGPDGLCSVDGCYRRRAAHLDARQVLPEYVSEPYQRPDGTWFEWVESGCLMWSRDIEAPE
jgi:hypothetical protein